MKIIELDLIYSLNFYSRNVYFLKDYYRRNLRRDIFKSNFGTGGFSNKIFGFEFYELESIC